MIKGLLPVVDAELGFNFVAAQNFIKRLIAQHIDDDFKNFYKFIVSRIKEDNFINTQHGFEMIGELISFSYSEIKEANIPFFRTVDDLEVLMTALAKVEIATNHGPFSIVSDYTLDRKAFALKLNKRFDWDSFINFCFEDDKFKDGLLDFSKCKVLNETRNLSLVKALGDSPSFAQSLINTGFALILEKTILPNSKP